MEIMQEYINTKKYDSLQGIRTVKERKRFESYIGYAFSKELECEKYIQNTDFSFQFEKNQIENILNQHKLETKEKEEIPNDLNNFENNLNDLKPKSSTDENNNSKSESKSDKKNITKTSSEDNNQNKINNINNTKKKNTEKKEKKSDKKNSKISKKMI